MIGVFIVLLGIRAFFMRLRRPLRIKNISLVGCVFVIRFMRTICQLSNEAKPLINEVKFWRSRRDAC